MSKKHKIRTTSDDALDANPFTALDRSGLPKGKMKPPVTLPEHKSVKEKSKGRVEVRCEKAGRGGKTVTTLKDFPSHIPLYTLEAITFELKKMCLWLYIKRSRCRITGRCLRSRKCGT